MDNYKKIIINLILSQKYLSTHIENLLGNIGLKQFEEKMKSITEKQKTFSPEDLEKMVLEIFSLNMNKMLTIKDLCVIFNSTEKEIRKAIGNLESKNKIRKKK